MRIGSLSQRLKTVIIFGESQLESFLYLKQPTLPYLKTICPIFCLQAPRTQKSSVLTADMTSNEQHLAAQTRFAQSARSYRPSGWVTAFANLRSTTFSFDYWWQQLAGHRMITADMAHKQPPVPLLSVARLEVDALIQYREAAKAAGLDPSVKAAKYDARLKAELMTKARISNPAYVDAHNRMFHHMWHVWVLPPASSLSLIMKYISIGLITGTIAASIWRYGYHLPERRKIDAFYKTLYSEHPEFWPALAMQKKNVRFFGGYKTKPRLLHTQSHLPSPNPPAHFLALNSLDFTFLPYSPTSLPTPFYSKFSLGSPTNRPFLPPSHPHKLESSSPPLSPVHHSSALRPFSLRFSTIYIPNGSLTPALHALSTGNIANFT